MKTASLVDNYITGTLYFLHITYSKNIQYFFQVVFLKDQTFQVIDIMVSSNITSIETLDDLQRFIYRTICKDHELLMNDFPTTEKIIRKPNGYSCGMMFCLHGPRKTEFSAIWEKEKNRVLFYGSNGQRYQQIILEECRINDLELN